MSILMVWVPLSSNNRVHLARFGNSIHVWLDDLICWYLFLYKNIKNILLYILYQYLTFLFCFHQISGMSVLSLSLIKSRHLGFTSCAAGIFAKLYINVWGFLYMGVGGSDCTWLTYNDYSIEFWKLLCTHIRYSFCDSITNGSEKMCSYPANASLPAVLLKSLL